MNLATVLQLTRPLAVLDLETTGLGEHEDRIIQIALTKHYPDKDPVRWVTYLNPGIPVPPEIQRVHGIRDEMLTGAPPFEHFAKSLAATLVDLDFAGHNVLFDLRMLRAAFRRAKITWNWEETCKVIDTLRIYQIKDPRDLSAAYFRFVKKMLVVAHDAGTDVQATEEILAGQLNEFPDLPRTVDALADVCWPQKPGAVDRAGKFVWRHGEACLGFGKHIGKPLRNCDRGYLEWMLKGDFPPDVKAILTDALQGRFPKKDP